MRNKIFPIVVLFISFAFFTAPLFGQSPSPRKNKKTKKSDRRTKPSSKPTKRAYLHRFSLPKKFDGLQKSLDGLLKEAKALGLGTQKKPQGVYSVLKMTLGPVHGTYIFLRKDLKKLPRLFRGFRNFKKLSLDGKARLTLESMEVLVHSLDALVTTRLTIKVCVKFGRNLGKYWKLGGLKALGAAIAKTSLESAKDLKQYIQWAQYSYRLKNTLRYIRKNFQRIKGKLDNFLREVRSVLKKKFPQFRPPTPHKKLRNPYSSPKKKKGFMSHQLALRKCA